MRTLILASGHGRESLLRWLSGSVFLPELLQLDVRFESSSSYGSVDSESCEVSFLLEPSRSRLLLQVLQATSSGWRLTSWSARKADSVFLATSGRDGVGGGAG